MGVVKGISLVFAFSFLIVCSACRAPRHTFGFTNEMNQVVRYEVTRQTEKGEKGEKGEKVLEHTIEPGDSHGWMFRMPASRLGQPDPYIRKARLITGNDCTIRLTGDELRQWAEGGKGQWSVSLTPERLDCVPKEEDSSAE